MRLVFSFFLLILGVWLAGCSSDEKKADTPEGAYAIAQDYEKDERFEEALRRYQEVKNKYPYSKYALMAEMAVADVYYKQESFAEAQVAYQNFKDLHPKHPQIDYATFRLGMSFYNQLPPTIDRDLTLASSAILYLDEVIKQYPNSAHVKEAQEKKESAIKMLAEKEQYIADFYFKKEIWESAMVRYENLARTYPGMGFDIHALSQAALSASRNGDQDKAKKLLAELQRRFPNSKEVESVEKEIRK